MSNALYQDLAWLQRPPADFNAQCKALATTEAPGKLAQTLAGYGLSEGQLGRLGRAIDKCARDGKPLARCSRSASPSSATARSTCWCRCWSPAPRAMASSSTA